MNPALLLPRIITPPATKRSWRPKWRASMLGVHRDLKIIGTVSFEASVRTGSILRGLKVLWQDEPQLVTNDLPNKNAYICTVGGRGWKHLSNIGQPEVVLHRSTHPTTFDFRACTETPSRQMIDIFLRHVILLFTSRPITHDSNKNGRFLGIIPHIKINRSYRTCLYFWMCY